MNQKQGSDTDAEPEFLAPDGTRPRIASKSKLSIARLWRRVAKTTVRLVCSRITTRTTMQLSSLVRTDTTSKWFATKPRRALMNNGFCKFPQTRFWHEVCGHLSTLPGVAVTDTADDQQEPEPRFLERRLQELEKNDWAAVENAGCQTTRGAAQLKQKEKVP